MSVTADQRHRRIAAHGSNDVDDVIHNFHLRAHTSEAAVYTRPALTPHTCIASTGELPTILCPEGLERLRCEHEGPGQVGRASAGWHGGPARSRHGELYTQHNVDVEHAIFITGTAGAW